MLNRWEEILREAGLDSVENRANISHPFYSRFANGLVKVFEILRDNNLFSQETYSAIMQEAPCASNMSTAMLNLKNANLLTRENYLVLLRNAGNANRLSEIIIRSERTRPQMERFARQLSAALTDMDRQQLLPISVNQQQLTNIVFPMDLVPEKYQCVLTNNIMDDPIRLPMTNQICDRQIIIFSLAQSSNQNPFNRQPMTIDDVIDETELKSEINNYVSLIVEAVNAQLTALNRVRGLTLEEYAARQTAVLNRMELLNLPYISQSFRP